MMSDKRREYRAWTGSLVVHFVLFVIVSLSGLFVVVAPKVEKPVDVTLYDMDAGGSQGAGGAPAPMEAAPPPPAPSFDDVVIDRKKEEKLPEIEDKFTKEPEKQEEYKKEHNAPAVPTVTAANPIYAVGGTGDGSGSNIHAGAVGSGSGNGEGAGNGDGAGSGSGDGIGVSNEKTKRPAIPPTLIAAPEPVYPESLRQKNVKGKVTVRITVGPDGNVESAEIESSSGHGEMDQAALDAAWGYRYTTAYNEYGEAVSFRKRIRITFKLR